MAAMAANAFTPLLDSSGATEVGTDTTRDMMMFRLLRETDRMSV